MTADPFAARNLALEAPSPGVVSITPTDGADLVDAADGNAPFIAHAIYLGTAGTVSLVDGLGVARSISLGAGWHPFGVRRINATGTDAALGILALRRE